MELPLIPPHIYLFILFSLLLTRLHSLEVASGPQLSCCPHAFSHPVALH